MIDVVTVGWLTLDDIVLPDHTWRPNVLGGGALYSAIGAQIWGKQVGIHSVTGRQTLDQTCAAIRARGLDAEGVGAIGGVGLQLWLLHESATFKQQVPKLKSSTAGEMDRGRGPLPAAYASARGFHVAPQSPVGSIESARKLRDLPGRPLVTMDILSDEYIDRRLYADLDFLHGVTAFLPSEAEIARIWNPPDLHQWMRREAAAHNCHLVAKLGERGSIACDARTGSLIHAPAYSTRVVDTTGAGDGYCGGFLVGLLEDRPIAECAAMGTVSASYVVEACGALQTAPPKAADRDARLRRILAEVHAN
jgi:sugar/nucleoside kinase (ribokinase family)